jgi:large subunit ribosomal protein L22
MELEAREFRAEARFQRVSPQKARLVLNLIKGQGVGQAIETVTFTKKGVAPLVKKVLTSAVDNAKYLSEEQGLDLDLDSLYVKRAVANDGPRLKRIRPAPMGRAYRYQRRLSHIVIAVAERPEAFAERQAAAAEAPEKKTRRPAKKAAVKRAGAKKAAAKKAPAKKMAAGKEK